MGNKSSSKKNPVELQNIIDTIATYYILTMDFQNLSKLSEKDHCDKLVILTSDIISKYFTLQEVSFLEERVINGEQTDIMDKEKIVYLTKDKIESLDVQNKYKEKRKKQICIGIAKFYIIIAHVFASIVMTINPIYTYVDDSGVKHEYNIYEKDKIPKDATRSIKQLNICKNRIDSLQHNQDQNDIDATGNINISPNICSINLMSSGEVKSLADEPGIPELKQLYLDEQYDFSTGIFKGMTKETEKQFKSDLKQFYTVFTGNSVMPDDIKDFSDIKLKNYSNDENCINDKFKNTYTGNINNELFSHYADNIKKMIKNANRKQNELLEIINVLFTYVIDPHSGKKTIRINPTLKDNTLETAVKTTRKIIIDLYSTCEMDYLKGVEIYEAIINKIGFSTLNSQKTTLEKTVGELSNVNTPLESVQPNDFALNEEEPEQPLTPPEEPLTPSEQPLTPSEEPLTPPEDPLTPSEEPLTPSEEPSESDTLYEEEPLTPPEEPVESDTLYEEEPLTPSEEQPSESDTLYEEEPQPQQPEQFLPPPQQFVPQQPEQFVPPPPEQFLPPPPQQPEPQQPEPQQPEQFLPPPPEQFLPPPQQFEPQPQQFLPPPQQFEPPPQQFVPPPQQFNEPTKSPYPVQFNVINNVSKGTQNPFQSQPEQQLEQQPEQQVTGGKKKRSRRKNKKTKKRKTKKYY